MRQVGGGGGWGGPTTKKIMPPEKSQDVLCLFVVGQRTPPSNLKDRLKLQLLLTYLSETKAELVL